MHIAGFQRTRAALYSSLHLNPSTMLRLPLKVLVRSLMQAP